MNKISNIYSKIKKKILFIFHNFIYNINTRQLNILFIYYIKFML